MMKNELITYFQKHFEKDHRETEFKGIEFDSRMIQPGQIFLALQGSQSHGVEFIEEVIEKKAKAIVIDPDGEKYLDRNYPIDIIRVSDALQAFQEFAKYYRTFFKGKVIGITGSAGKTTVKEMVKQVLQHKFKVESTKGNFNNHLGLPYSIVNASLTADFYVFEIGTNHPGEIEFLASIMDPDWSLITNIGTAHIGYFGSQEAIYQEKKKLFDLTRPEGILFINADDPFLKQYSSDKRRISFALDNKTVDYTFTVSGMTSEGNVMLQTTGGREFTLQIPGLHQAINALMAYAIGMKAGIEEEAIIEALRELQPINKRMEVVQEFPFMIINDAYNANRESTLASIEFLEKVRGKRKIFVFGDIFELGEYSRRIHMEIGERLANSTIDKVYIIGQEASKLKEKYENEKFIYKETHDDIAVELINEIKEGDVVLFKASRGMKLEKIVDKIVGKKNAG